MTPPLSRPVTILKPVCGVEPATYDCLNSFCAQDYSPFQIVFGVADPHDPVIAVLTRLQHEYPQHDIQIVVERREHGTSHKVSNLMNMLPAAKHEYLVIADSDVRVHCDYLSRLVPALAPTEVGIVTCAYRGTSHTGIWSLLGTLFINEWFIPSVQIAAMSGSRAFAFGATIGIRREVLDRIGGFARIADQLADDYRLGELTRAVGLRTVLSDVVVEIAVLETNFKALIAHEMRWLRTIRAVKPLAYGFTFVTCGIPIACIGALMARGARGTLILLCVTLAARTLTHLSERQSGASFGQLLLLPIRDTLTLVLWFWGLLARRVRWRNTWYRIGRDGTVLSS